MRPAFAYHRPATVQEACRILAAEPRAAVLAGGTDLMVHLTQSWRGKRPPAVVNVKRIPGLDTVQVTDRALRLGALATLSALMEHPVIQAEYPVLPFTARYMGSPAIRNLATVGGNLCNASPAADLPPVLLALDAEVGIAGPGGERRSPLDRVLPGARARPRCVRASCWSGSRSRAVARPGPSATSDSTSGGRWTSRSPGLPSRRRDGAAEARVALCAVAPTPLRVTEAEAGSWSSRG